MKAISVSDLSAGYGDAPVIKNISFDLECGRNLSIMGANGSGKTTLLRSLNGLLEARGQIQILGQDLSKLKRREIAGMMAMMSQLSSVYFSYTVRETVELGRFARHDNERHQKNGYSLKLSHMSLVHDREVVDKCLELTGLKDIEKKSISALSGGQLQRVFLARCFAQETPIILLDEPTNHLDLKYQAELMEHLEEWSKGQTKLADGTIVPNTLVGVFHDISLAAQISSDMIFIKNGEVFCQGEKDKVFTAEVLENTYGMDVAGYMNRQRRVWGELTT